MVSHNNALPNQHFRKEWDVRVRTWLDQPMAKLRRRAARKAKAAKIAPRPAAGPLRPVVRCPTIKYNTKVRAGRGFTVEEIKGAGLSPAKAKTLGIAVDFRRSNKSVESLTANVERIKAYLEKLVIFPSKSGAKAAAKAGVSPAAERAAVTQFKGAILPITQAAPSINFVKVSEAVGDRKIGAYATLRQEQTNARLVGKREKKAREAAEEKKDE